MPGFPWLAENEVDGENIQNKMRLFRDRFGVPYTEDILKKHQMLYLVPLSLTLWLPIYSN